MIELWLMEVMRKWAPEHMGLKYNTAVTYLFQERQGLPE